MNGKPGDHPLSDILDHGRDVYSKEADALVRELAKLVPRYRLWDLADWYPPPAIEEFIAQLQSIRNDLLQQARDSGWEV